HHLAEVFHFLDTDAFPPVGELLQQHAGRIHLQRPLCNGQQAELLRDYLALLGDLDAPPGGLRRQRRERTINWRSTAAPDASAPAVKKSEPDSCLVEQFRQ